MRLHPAREREARLQVLAQNLPRQRCDVGILRDLQDSTSTHLTEIGEHAKLLKRFQPKNTF